MGIKENVIEAHGLNDGHDDDRFEQAVKYSKELDCSVVLAFRALLSLEKKELIVLHGGNINGNGTTKTRG